MTRGGVHHVDLTVSDPRASKPFYAAVLGFMGYEIVEEREDFIDFRCDMPEGHACYVGIGCARGPNAARPHDRYAAGLHHIAWRAESRADVDAMHALLVQIGARVLDAPADYPQYGDGYYAVFFADRDGLKLEFVYKP